MNDMSGVIIAKSDQINADDLIAGPRTITVTAVKITAGTEQPVAISFEGDNKVWRPCKTASRVLVGAWGADAKAYVGRSLTLYRDPTVKWGGMEVGGIRISHMSHLERDLSLAVMEKKGSRKMITVRKLAEQPAAKPTSTGRTPEQMVEAFIAKVNECTDHDALADLQNGSQNFLSRMMAQHPDLHKRAIAALVTRAEEMSNDPPRTNDDHGDQFDGTEDAFGLRPVSA
jgi:hypothetical protein